MKIYIGIVSGLIINIGLIKYNQYQFNKFNKNIIKKVRLKLKD